MKRNQYFLKTGFAILISLSASLAFAQAPAFSIPLDKMEADPKAAVAVVEKELQANPALKAAEVAARLRIGNGFQTNLNLQSAHTQFQTCAKLAQADQALDQEAGFRCLVGVASTSRFLDKNREAAQTLFDSRKLPIVEKNENRADLYLELINSYSAFGDLAKAEQLIAELETMLKKNDAYFQSLTSIWKEAILAQKKDLAGAKKAHAVARRWTSTLAPNVQWVSQLMMSKHAYFYDLAAGEYKNAKADAAKGLQVSAVPGRANKFWVAQGDLAIAYFTKDHALFDKSLKVCRDNLKGSEAEAALSLIIEPWAKLHAKQNIDADIANIQKAFGAQSLFSEKLKDALKVK